MYSGPKIAKHTKEQQCMDLDICSARTIPQPSNSSSTASAYNRTGITIYGVIHVCGVGNLPLGRHLARRQTGTILTANECGRTGGAEQHERDE